MNKMLYDNNKLIVAALQSIILFLCLTFNPNITLAAPHITLEWFQTPNSIARTDHTATLLPNGEVLVTGGADNLGNTLTSSYIYNPIYNTWTSTSNLNTGRKNHVATLLKTGDVLVSGGTDSSGNALISAEIYSYLYKTWTPVGNLNFARSGHTMTLLTDGRILIVGGTNESEIELYQPRSKTFSINVCSDTNGSSDLNNPRYTHTANYLSDGSVLISGGISYDTGLSLTSTELFNPDTNCFFVSSDLNTSRAYQTTTGLNDGNLLTYGREDTLTRFSELFSDNIWTTSGAVNSPRQNHSAALLPSGKVLIYGGQNELGTYLSSSEAFNPMLSRWENLSPLSTSVARKGATLTVLHDGSVLAVGGSNNTVPAIDSSERLRNFTDQTSEATTTQFLRNARYNHASVVLADGNILISGGQSDANTILKSVELFDISSATTKTAADMTYERINHTLTLLPDGRVLAIGGELLDGTCLNSVEIYNPKTDTWTERQNLSSTPNGGARSRHTAKVVYKDDNFLIFIIGGYSAADTTTSTVQVYNYLTDTWTETTPLNTARFGHTTNILKNGNILVTGGYNDTDGFLSSTEEFDINTNIWTTGNMPTQRAFHTLTKLLTGDYLVIGGENSTGVDNSVDIYQNNNSWTTSTAYLNTGRKSHTASLISDGRIIIAGGINSSGNVTNSIEIYDPLTNNISNTLSLSTPKTAFTAHLIDNQKIAFIGGWNQADALIGNYSIGFFESFVSSDKSLYPTISKAYSVYGNKISLKGNNFVGTTEASSGQRNNSAVNFPIVQIRSLLNEEFITIANPDNTIPWSDTSYSSLALDEIFPGPSLVTVYSRGIASKPAPFQAGIALDHFDIKTAGTGTDIATQKAGVTFNISITAKDKNGNSLIIPTDTVEITSNCTISEDTETTIFLTNGYVESIPITLEKAATDCTVTVTYDEIESTSSEFTVTNAELDHFIIEQSQGGNIPDFSVDNVFSIKATAYDKFENIVLNFNSPVDVSSTGVLRLGAGESTSFVNGILNSYDIAFEKTGSAEITFKGIEPTTGDEIITTSNTFNVTHGVLRSFKITTNNGADIPDQTAGIAFTIKIQALDAYDNIVTSFMDTANISINQNTITSGGGITPNFINGVLSNHSLVIEKATVDYQIKVTKNSVQSYSNPFDVLHANLNSLLIELKGGGAIPEQYAGIDFKIQITVLDRFNNIVKSFNGEKVKISSDVTLLKGAGETAEFVDGFLEEHTVAIGKGTDIKIYATALNGTAYGSSNPFSIHHVELDHFYIYNEEGLELPEQTAGHPFGITAVAMDPYDNIVKTFSGQVEIKLLDGEFVNSRTETNSFVQGELLIPHKLTITKVGNYKLQVKHTNGTESGESNQFYVKNDKLAFFTVKDISGNNITTQTAGYPFQLLLTAYDIYNNIALDFEGTVNFSSNYANIVSGNISDNFQEGVLRSHTIVLTKSGSYILTATDSEGTANGSTNNFFVEPAELHHFKITTKTDIPIVMILENKTFPIKIVAFDKYENIATYFNDAVNISVSNLKLKKGAGLTDNFFNGILLNHDIIIKESGLTNLIATHQTSGIQSASQRFAVISELFQSDSGRKSTFTISVKENYTPIDGVVICAGELGCRVTDAEGYSYFDNALRNWNYVVRMQKEDYIMSNPKITLRSEIKHNTFDFKTTSNPQPHTDCVYADHTAERILLGNNAAQLYNTARKTLRHLQKFAGSNAAVSKKLRTTLVKIYNLFQDSNSLSFNLPVVEFSYCSMTDCKEISMRNLKREIRLKYQSIFKQTRKNFNLCTSSNIKTTVRAKREFRKLRTQLRALKDLLEEFSNSNGRCY